jgi:hypothetical protein
MPRDGEDLGTKVVPLIPFLRSANDALESDASAAALLRVAAESAFGSRHTRSQLFRLLARAGMWPRLKSAEFVEELGEGRLKAKSVMRYAFLASSNSPDEAASDVTSLLRSGATSISSDTCVRQLVRGLLPWKGSPDSLMIVLGGVVGELNSSASVGRLFKRLLQLSVEEGLWESEWEVAHNLVRLVHAAGDDILDLPGGIEGVVAELTPFCREKVENALRAMALEADSDADENGNLAGFVVDSDEEEEDDEDEDEDEDDEAEEVGGDDEGDFDDSDDDEEEEGEEVGRKAIISHSSFKRRTAERGKEDGKSPSRRDKASHAPAPNRKRRRLHARGSVSSSSSPTGSFSSDSSGRRFLALAHHVGTSKLSSTSSNKTPSSSSSASASVSGTLSKPFSSASARAASGPTLPSRSSKYLDIEANDHSDSE